MKINKNAYKRTGHITQGILATGAFLGLINFTNVYWYLPCFIVTLSYALDFFHYIKKDIYSYEESTDTSARLPSELKRALTGLFFQLLLIGFISFCCYLFLRKAGI